MGRHAGRRHRPARPARPRRPARHARSWPCSTRSSSCSPRRPRTPTRSCAASAPRSGSRTSTTASGRSSTSAGRTSASTRATCTTSAASSPRSSRRPGRCAWDGILDGEILAWKDGLVLPFIALQGRLGRKSPSAAIQADVPVIYVAFDALALGAAAEDGSGPVEPLLREPLRTRRERLDAIDLPSATEGGRFIRSFLAVGRRRGRPRGGLRGGAGPAQRGPDGQGPDQRLLAGSPRPGLAEDEEGARDHRLRRRRRRGRPRQAPRRPVRLHVRRPRHRDRPPGHDRQGLQRPDRCRDRRDDPLVRGPHDRPVRPLPRGRAARSSSRSRST